MGLAVDLFGNGKCYIPMTRRDKFFYPLGGSGSFLASMEMNEATDTAIIYELTEKRWGHTAESDSWEYRLKGTLYHRQPETACFVRACLYLLEQEAELRGLTPQIDAWKQRRGV